jgi:hypothetical protein
MGASYGTAQKKNKEKTTMKPEYANTFGIRKVTDPQGDVLEVTLDIAYKYAETSITVSQNGLENVSTPTAEILDSIVMNKQSAISLRNLLIQTLGDE